MLFLFRGPIQRSRVKTVKIPDSPVWTWLSVCAWPAGYCDHCCKQWQPKACNCVQGSKKIARLWETSRWTKQPSNIVVCMLRLEEPLPVNFAFAHTHLKKQRKWFLLLTTFSSPSVRKSTLFTVSQCVISNLYVWKNEWIKKYIKKREKGFFTKNSLGNILKHSVKKQIFLEAGVPEKFCKYNVFHVKIHVLSICLEHLRSF